MVQSKPGTRAFGSAVRINRSKRSRARPMRSLSSSLVVSTSATYSVSLIQLLHTPVWNLQYSIMEYSQLILSQTTTTSFGILGLFFFKQKTAYEIVAQIKR